MSELEGVMDDVFGEGDPKGDKLRRRRRRLTRRARAEAAAGTSGFVGPGDRRTALDRLNLRSCGLITGILIVLAVIAVVIATSGGGDDETREAVSTQPESSVEEPGAKDDTDESASDGLLDVYVLTFEPSTCPDPNGYLEVPPAELRVGDTGTIEVWLPILRGTPDPRPFGELYLSGTTTTKDGGVFVYQIDPSIDAVTLDGTFRGSDVSGTYYLTITEDGQNVTDPCYKRPYTGTFDRTQPVST